MKYFSKIMTAIIPIVGILLGFFLGSFQETKISVREKKQQIYGKLKGQAPTARIDCVYFYEAYINSIYFKELYTLYENAQSDPSLGLAERNRCKNKVILERTNAYKWQEKLFEYRRAANESMKSLNEILGLMIMLYPKRQTLENYADEVFKYRLIFIEEACIPYTEIKTSIKQLDEWRENELDNIESHINFYKSLEEILLILKK